MDDGISMTRLRQLDGRVEQARSGLRRAAAFAGSAEPGTRPGARAVGVDIALAVIATTALLVMMAKTSTVHPIIGLLAPAGRLSHPVPIASAAGGLGWREALLGTACAAPLAFRRVRPLTAFWVILAAAVATPRYEANAITLIVVVLAAYSAVAYSRFRGVAMLCVPAVGFLVGAAYPDTAPRLPDGSTALLLLIPVVVAGNAMHNWRRQAGDSQARLARLQAEHEAATRRALELERARIAGELHDVVTHNVSVMIVQAGAARQVLAAAPDQARSAMLAVEASGRAAMTELRHLLGLFGPPGAADQVTSGDGGPASQELRPQPGLGQLRPLIDGVTAAGLPVDLHIGDLPHLPPGLDLAAFRVVQEALTNVIKHAGKPHTSVSVDYHDGGLVVAVADAGRPAGAAGPAIPGAGRGLLGLRERVALYGGELEAGPREGGGWLVRTRIPADLLPAMPPVP